jgi:ABC-type multidrug transport system fused ATPase/permease subunit
VKKSEKALKNQMKASLSNTVAQKIPIVFLESGTISIIFLLILIYVLQGGNIVELAPQLTAIAVAIVRLIPAAKQISAAQNTMVYKEPSLDAIMEFEDMMSREKTVVNKHNNEVITCRNEFGFEGVSFKYKNSSENILENVTIRFNVGEAIGIKGVSGGGKTTTVDILLGLLYPYEGIVVSDGQNIMDNGPAWRKKISYIPQNIYLIDDTIKANICFGIPDDQIDEKKLESVIKDAELEALVSQLPMGVDTKIGERGARLSGGQKQRIGIARALYKEAEILILDEATSALDNQTENDVMQAINCLQGKKTLIIIAHRLTTLEKCDSIYELKDGKFIRER